MSTIEGRVPTPRADRYLAQLCDHLGHLPRGTASHDQHGRHGDHGSAPSVRRIDRDGNRAVIELDWGAFVLTATPTELEVTVVADDPQALDRGRQLIQGRIETIGRRDDLAVTWRQPAGPD